VIYQILTAASGKPPKERDYLKDQGIDGRMRSEWILGRLAGWRGVDPAGSGQGPMAVYCKYGDEPAGSGATELASLVEADQRLMRLSRRWNCFTV
jgi:hypothetical protein